MSYTLEKVCRFEAAHHIPEHQGACRFPHGHSYKVRFVIEVERLDQHGFVIDFGQLSSLCKKFDHVDLNEVSPFADGSVRLSPTAERIAHYLAHSVLELLSGRGLYVEVTVWETEGASVTYTANEGR